MTDDWLGFWYVMTGFMVLFILGVIAEDRGDGEPIFLLGASLGFAAIIWPFLLPMFVSAAFGPRGRS